MIKKPTLRSKIIEYSGFFRVYRYIITLQHADSNSEEDYLICEKSRSVGVLPFHKSFGEFIFVRQFRPIMLTTDPDSTDYCLTEIPAGGCDDQNSLEANAIRETEEETGYRPKKLIPIGECHSSPGLLAEKVVLYFSEIDETMKVSAGGGLSAENEAVEVIRLSPAQAYRMLDNREFSDAKTMLALHTVRSRFPGC